MAIKQRHTDAIQRKALEEYLALPYTYSVFLAENDDGPYWATRVNEIKGANGHGDTPEAALACARESLRYWLEGALMDATIPIPEPGQDAPGKLLVRVPRSVHRDLMTRAPLARG